MIKFWLVGFLILSASFAFLVFGVKNRVDLETERSGDFLEIRGSVVTLYKPNHDFVNIIVLHLKNPNFLNKQDFVFSIFEEGEVVRSVKFNGQNVGDPSDLRFQFEPIIGSKGKSLVIKVEGGKDSPFLSVATSGNRDLAYRAYYRSASREDALKDVAENFSSRIFKDLGFFIIWLLALCGIVVLGVKKHEN